jgi:hypothetical protein
LNVISGPVVALVLIGGPLVDAAWCRLLERSKPRLNRFTAGEPDLHLLVDGVRLDGRVVGKGVHTFRLKKPPTSTRVSSRAAAQDALGLTRDPRLLGVALRHGVARAAADVDGR